MTFVPMLAIASTGASGRHPTTVEQLVGTHSFDLKHDGIRGIAQGGRLFARTGADISDRFPDIVAALRKSPKFERLDGELVAASLRFSHALLRNQQRKPGSIRRHQLLHPMRFVVFDMPSDDLMRAPYSERRAALEAWTSKERVHSRIMLSPSSEDPAFVREMADLGMEGVVAKRLGSRYQQGKRSADWVKFKNTQRITALVAGYQPGNGHRRHFGNMQLVLIDDTHPDGLLPIGDVGTGWTERETVDLKRRLDAGETLMVEIEAMNRTDDNQLRFPVYRGIRTDVDLLSCNTEQLDVLPVY